VQKNPSSEANSLSASQKIPRLFWNRKFHYRAHNSPPLLLILSQMNLVHTFRIFKKYLQFFLRKLKQDIKGVKYFFTTTTTDNKSQPEV